MTYYDLWVTRDLSGALRIWTDEPVWDGEAWQLPMADVRARNVGYRWVRKLPPAMFRNVEPGQKIRIRGSA